MEGWIIGGSHIAVKKGSITLWEGGVDNERIVYRCLKGGYILGRRGDTGSVTYRCLKGGIFWEG